MWQFIKVIQLNTVPGGWRALVQLSHNGISGMYQIPSDTMHFAEKPTEPELLIMGQHLAIQKNMEANTPPTFTLSKFAFRNRFTMEERIALDNASLSTALTDMQKATICTIMKDFDAAPDPLDMRHESMRTALYYFESNFLLQPGRAQEIMGIT